MLRELGRGAFARVFLAEQSDLDHRLVVLKVSTRATAEPRLLARARHAHIVEVLRHAVADDGALHLVCMPFLGGASLASVLEERRRRKRRPRTGRDLLSDLDRVSAPEYPATELARPAREILGRLSHAQALAWIVARLAEALDHAHQRGVAHGDLKPSNILLTAEANPLLLDFNLSVDWRDDWSGEPMTELGGTLAYMAPERLDAIASGGRDRPRKSADLHRADIFGLGLLLLEALTGQVPEVPPRQTGNPRDLAADLASLRRSLPHSLEPWGDRSIPPALRSILARALAPDPRDRYARGNELAEDLDRWRSDRPLVFADEPRTSGLTRQVRRRRATLITFGLTMATAVLVAFFASIILQGTRRDQALAKYAMIIDRVDSGVFGFRESLWRIDELGDPTQLASRHLARYDVLNDPDWRDRDDVRSLPDRERDELEVWLFEQILRYAMALGEVPESPESWRRGLALLDRTLERVDSGPLEAQRRVLLDRLDRRGRPRFGPKVRRLPNWMEVYLTGIAAEPLHAREAMGHYLEVLKERPNLFWAHYRTVVVACRINEYQEAARHLRICSGRSPANPILHTLLGLVLYKELRDMFDSFKHDPFSKALQECERALEIDPEYGEAHRIRALILKDIGQSDSAEASAQKFAVSTRLTSPVAAMELRRRLMYQRGPNFFNDWYGLRGKTESLIREALEFNPNDRNLRQKLASVLVKDGRTEEAVREFDRVIEGDPDQLVARFLRAEQLLSSDLPTAFEELNRLIDHPRFEEIFPVQPKGLMAYHYVALILLKRGQCAEALEVAERSLIHVKRARALFLETRLSRHQFVTQRPFAPEGQTIYLMAQIHATAAKAPGITEQARRDHRDKAIELLFHAFKIHSTFCTDKAWYPNDRLFDDLRGEIDRRLKEAKPAG